MVCGHGSRDKDAEREFGRVAAGLKQRFPELPVEYGFLEFSAPNIHMGLNALIDQGVEEILAVPGMLFAATHAKNDIPSVLTTFGESCREHGRQVEVQYGEELGLQPAMIDAFQSRIYEALGLDPENPPESLYDTLLVVVGRGTSDTEANAEAAKLTRIVNENMGFGWADTVYSGVTYPSVGIGLEKLLKLGYKRVVVAPYFLFTGRLIKRIYGYVDKVAAENPGVEFIKADYLNDHPKVIDAFENRVREIMGGEVNGDENLMQSFQRRLAAGEVDIHHHHAEYQPDGDNHEHTHSHEDSHGKGHSHTHHHGHHHHGDPSHDHSHGHSHDHSHDHGHSHGIYKHIAHPLGPRTMIGEGICCCFMSQFPQEILDEEADRIGDIDPASTPAHQ
ncbi:sirohydrochlorin chelatase [Motiliproteus coralliicola]|uniref:Sirohydrochlorin chelatase n=1 Tax=Motiliproteus coralliicola TaxID=2283196 RepID=A0A369WCC0_9GAMM|nr:sirohydrochlorin chelatase [Motiliproteus coralliicola]RDE18266.1 sirohydrochlorin chelatase [Motiliproteus coralliicola]